MFDGFTIGSLNPNGQNLTIDLLHNCILYSKVLDYPETYATEDIIFHAKNDIKKNGLST